MWSSFYLPHFSFLRIFKLVMFLNKRWASRCFIRNKWQKLSWVSMKMVRNQVKMTTECCSFTKLGRFGFCCDSKNRKPSKKFWNYDDTTEKQTYKLIKCNFCTNLLRLIGVLTALVNSYKIAVIICRAFSKSVNLWSSNQFM